MLASLLPNTQWAQCALLGVFFDTKKPPLSNLSVSKIINEETDGLAGRTVGGLQECYNGVDETPVYGLPHRLCILL